MEFGFAVLSTPPDVAFRFCGPFDGPFLCNNLAVHAEGGTVCALAGRLFYRDEAAKPLTSGGRPVPDPARDNPAALALALYRHSGTAGLARLEGEFALVVWDPGRRRLIARRDPLGAYPLFWTRSGNTVALATGMRPLLDLLPTRTLNPAYLAAFLMSSGMGWERPDEACVYDGIRRVLPSCIVSIDADSGAAERLDCWDWPRRAVDPGSDRLEDIAPAYRTLLHDAVRERLGASPATHLSGGMDSTTITLLALEAVAADGGRAPLHALSLVYEQLPSLKLERAYIEAVLARQADNLAAHRIVADDLLHFDSLINPPVHDEPFTGLWCLQSDQALVDLAASLGVDALLTGHGGDDLLDMMPYHLGDLVRRGRLFAAWDEACAWARARGSTPMRILQLCMAAPGSRGSFFASLLPRFGTTAVGPATRLPRWVTPDFARQSGHLVPKRQEGAQARRPAPPAAIARAITGIERRVGDPHRWLLAAPRGIALSHPFLDPRVVCFGLGLQQRYRPDPDQIKPVLAASMRDLLPDNIRTRRDKRSFNEIYYLGLARNLPALRKMIGTAPAESVAMFDRTMLVDRLQAVALGTGDFYEQRDLDTTLSLIAWLTQRAAWQNRPIAWRHVIQLPSRPA